MVVADPLARGRDPIYVCYTLSAFSQIPCAFFEFHTRSSRAERNGVLTDPAAPNAWNPRCRGALSLQRLSLAKTFFDAASVLAQLLISRRARLISPKQAGQRCAKRAVKSSLEASSSVPDVSRPLQQSQIMVPTEIVLMYDAHY